VKWFKHLSGSLNNSIIAESIERFGSDGYLVFFGILEMLSDEFDIHNPGKLTIRMKKITKNLQLSRQKTVKILRFFDEKAKNNSKKDVSFFADIGKVDVIINCKRLAKLCDNHTQKLLKDTSKSLQSKNEVTSSQRSKKKEIRSKKKEYKDIYSQNSDEFRLSKLLYSLILKRNPKQKKPDFQKWSEYINKLIRINKRSVDEIEKIIEWCQQDSFWQNNILSAEKLRKQIDILYLKMNERKNNHGSTGTKSTKYAGIGKTTSP